MLANQKHLFSLDEGTHYLNCAYKAPLLKSSEEAAIQSLIKQRNPANISSTDYFEEAEEARELFGKLVNCEASEIAILPSTSYGFSSVLNNIPCKKGQHALTIENEFPSDYFSIQAWCVKNETVLKVIPSNPELIEQGKDWNERILESITEDTAVVILSSIHWMTGLKFELQQIGERCKKVGAKFIVDGTQSVGALPMDVKAFHIDALICATYKWLFGPYSVVLSYIGEAFNEGTPLEETWMNRVNAQDFSKFTEYNPNYTPNAGRYNVGQFSNLVLMPMLIAALKQINRWTVDGIQSYCEQLIQPLLHYLNELGIGLEDKAYFSNHLFSLSLTEEIDPVILNEHLKKNKIILSVRGRLRVAVNVFNTEEDIAALINAIEASRI